MVGVKEIERKKEMSALMRALDSSRAQSDGARVVANGGGPVEITTFVMYSIWQDRAISWGSCEA